MIIGGGGLVGSLASVLTVQAETYQSGQSGKALLEIEAKGPSSEEKHKPMDLFVIMDWSGSTSVRREEMYTQVTKLIENVLTDEDRVIFAGYGGNTVNSYQGNVSVRLTKKQALEILKSKKSFTSELTFDGAVGEFEQIYDKFTNKNPVLSVIQFTDEWLDGETIDTSFAQWALKNAKTFMSVIYPSRNGFKSDDMLSVKSMKAAGHKNIVINPEQKTLDDTFRNTATEVIDKKGNILKAIISPEDGITVKSAKWILPDGSTKDIPVKAGKIEATIEALKDGKYKVEYTFEGKVTTKKTITGSLTNGNETKNTSDMFDPKPVSNPRGTQFKENDKVEKGVTKIIQEMTPDIGVEGGTITQGKDRIIEIGTKPTIQVENLSYRTHYRGNENLDAGKTNRVVDGKMGSKTITTRYHLTKNSEAYRNDPDYLDVNKVTKDIIRETTDQPVIVNPIDEIYEVGLKPIVKESPIVRETSFVDDFTKLEGTPNLLIEDGSDGLLRDTTRFTLVGNKAEPKREVTRVKEPINKVYKVYKGRGTKFETMDGKELSPMMIGKTFEPAKAINGYRVANESVNGVIKTYKYVPLANVRQRFFNTKGEKIKPDYVIENVDVGTKLNVGHPWGIDYKGVRHFPVLEKLPIEYITVETEDMVIDYVYDIPKEGEPNVPLNENKVKSIVAPKQMGNLSTRGFSQLSVRRWKR
mgnify:CR=1 FL=1